MNTDYRPANDKPVTVAIGSSSFAEKDPTPLEMLQQSGARVLPNPFGRRLDEAEIIEHLREADGLIAGLEPLNAAVLAAAPRLRAIARVGIGLDNVDLTAAATYGIKVSNTPDAPTMAVAELTVTAILTLNRRIIPADQALHNGQWHKIIGESLAGQTILLVGFGRIGRRVAALLRAFGPVILACDPALDDSTARAAGVRSVKLAEGLAIARIVSLHAAGNRPILTANEFALMPRGVMLLNAARGALIDEAALLQALDSGVVSQAWIDTFTVEPYLGPLIKYPQALLTPHVGTYTKQCRLAMETAAVKNLLRDIR